MDDGALPVSAISLIDLASLLDGVLTPTHCCSVAEEAEFALSDLFVTAMWDLYKRCGVAVNRYLRIRTGANMAYKMA